MRTQCEVDGVGVLSLSPMARACTQSLIWLSGGGWCVVCQCAGHPQQLPPNRIHTRSGRYKRINGTKFELVSLQDFVVAQAGPEGEFKAKTCRIRLARLSALSAWRCSLCTLCIRHEVNLINFFRLPMAVSLPPGCIRMKYWYETQADGYGKCCENVRLKSSCWARSMVGRQRCLKILCHYVQTPHPLPHLPNPMPLFICVAQTKKYPAYPGLGLGMFAMMTRVP